MREQWKKIAVCAIIALLGFSFQMWIEHQMRPYALGGVYFHRWSSERMMQTVPIEDLRDHPFNTLFNIHIQPPGFDAIRSLFAQIRSTNDVFSLVVRVDESLYVLGAMLNGLMGALIFLWLSRLTKPWFGMVAAALFIAHPACIFYATILDATLVSTVLILVMYYLLWRLRDEPGSSTIPLAVAVVVLFFTRAVFQWPALLVFGASLFLLKVPRREIGIFLAVTGAVFCLYLGKQYVQFGILSTSSFSGLNLVKTAGWPDKEYSAYLKGHDVLDPAQTPDKPMPDVLVRKWKMDGSPNFNHVAYLWKNKSLMKEYKKRVAATAIGDILTIYAENMATYFMPSTTFEKGKHVFINRLAWKGVYDTVFSWPVLPALLTFCGCYWLCVRWDFRTGLALLLPSAFIAFVSITCEKGENMRYKFFIEPVFYIFIASQLYDMAARLFRFGYRRRSSVEGAGAKSSM